VTILTGVKKGAPRGSEEDAYKAELETIEKLCNQVINERSLTERWKALLPEVKREPTFEDFKLVINTMTRKSLETTEEDPKRVRFLIALYKVIESTFKTPYSDEDRFTPVLPSTNSTYKTTRKDGGAYGEFKADFGTYDTKELIDVSEVAEEKEFFIRKGMGWALREYSYVNPKAGSRFVHASPLSALTKKEALKVINRLHQS